MLPGGPQALEHRPVSETGLGEALVQAVHRDGLSAGGRPFGEALRGRGGPGREHTYGVPRPRLVRVRALGAGVQGEAAASARRVGGRDGEPQLHATVLGQDEGCLQGEFVDQVAPDVLAGLERELDEGRTGQEGRAHHPVVPQPGVGGQGQPSGEEVAVGVGQLDLGAEQRVVGGAESGRRDVAVGAAGVEPVDGALEGVRRQVDAPGPERGVVRGPVDGRAAYVRGGEGREQGRGLVASGAERGGEGGGAGVVGQAGLGHRGEDPVGTELDVRGHARRLKGADAVEETNGLTDVPDPELGRTHLVGDEGAGQVRDDRDTGRGERQPRHHLAEVVEHPVHVRRVERVADGEALGLPVGERGHESERRVLVTGDDHRARAVDGGDAHPVRQQRQDLFLRSLHRDHHATGRQRLHQTAARRNQRARVGQRQDTRDVRGGDLTDGVPGQEVRLHTPGLDEAEQRHLDREQRGLRVLRTVQNIRVRPEQNVLQRQFQRVAHRVQRGRECRVGLVQLPAHPEPLAALSREEEGQLARRGRRALDQARRRAALGEGGQAGAEGVGVGGDDRRAVFEHGAGGHQRVPDVGRERVRVRLQVGQELLALGPQGLGGAGAQVPREGRRGGRDGRADRCGRGLREFDDGVGVRSAHAEGGDARAARAAGLGPCPLLGEQGDRARRPVDVR
ncbi:hypothetical protein EES37_20560 [Streptomyces sp. ADI91-18]|nr:hypothetical protein EES37_20560 [Streptomyces sp. ADI91-18]